jgi:hypothetical protein
MDIFADYNTTSKLRSWAKKQQVESALKRQALEKLAGYKRVTRGSEVICTIFELIEQAGLELPV